MSTNRFSINGFGTIECIFESEDGNVFFSYGAYKYLCHLLDVDYTSRVDQVPLLYVNNAFHVSGRKDKTAAIDFVTKELGLVYNARENKILRVNYIEDHETVCNRVLKWIKQGDNIVIMPATEPGLYYGQVETIDELNSTVDVLFFYTHRDIAEYHNEAAVCDPDAIFTSTHFGTVELSSVLRRMERFAITGHFQHESGHVSIDPDSIDHWTISQTIPRLARLTTPKRNNLISGPSSLYTSSESIVSQDFDPKDRKRRRARRKGRTGTGSTENLLDTVDLALNDGDMEKSLSDDDTIHTIKKRRLTTCDDDEDENTSDTEATEPVETWNENDIF